MIGIVVVTHGDLGEELLNTSEIIFGEKLKIKTFSAKDAKNAELIRKNLKKIIASSDKGEGVLVLTDLFGGTPSNICISLMDELHIEVISGVNIPMIMKAVSLENQGALEDVARKIKEYGWKSISSAGELLNKYKVSS